jgi:beta-N-acetylhexosaminidase
MERMTEGSLLVLGIEGPELTPAEAARFKALQPAGYILFTRNIVTPQQTRKLTDDLRDLSNDEPIIAIDQEGGRVTRTKEIAPVAPSAPALAAHGDVRSIAEAGCFTADLIRQLGFNLDFAPVLDLDHFPGTPNALRGRSWGRDPQRVIDHAGMWNRWLRKRHMASCGKHFPAGGRAWSDPHHDLPSSPATLEELLREDVLPFTALMPELDAVMLAHVEFPNIDPEFPASLSRRMIQGFLRDQLGFDHHVVLTDDLDMGAIADLPPHRLSRSSGEGDFGTPVQPHGRRPPARGSTQEKTPAPARLVGREMAGNPRFVGKTRRQRAGLARSGILQPSRWLLNDPSLNACTRARSHRHSDHVLHAEVEKGS